METQDQTQEMEMGSKPIAEHEWLQQLVGEWTTETEMWMGPDQPSAKVVGTESVESFGGLFAYINGIGKMPDGQPMRYRMAVGYDLTFNEYRACWIADVSSHIWNYNGTLSADGKTLELICEGPNMMGEGTAKYKDVVEIVDNNTRFLTSYGQQENGEWQQFMKCTIRRKS